jgi:DNA-binding Xre family transcriptional regulator
MPKKHKNIGSDFDDFLHEEGILGEVEALAVKEIVSHQLEELMNEQKITKMEMAKRMGTSRSAVDRLLDPHNSSVSLKTLFKAAASLGRKLNIQIA